MVEYTYDSNGIRTSKTVNGVKTDYTLNGTTIIAETTNGKTTWYDYDASGMIVGFTTDEQAYYYKKNAQGDVVAILDSNGVELASYVYDAWGNITAIIGDEQLAESNPFRYRGYYQDNESGFFYLQSRYYDSVVGRFLNADDVGIALVTSSIGLYGNLYSYCLNNPVNSTDQNGHFGTPLQWVCAVIGGIAGWFFGDYVARSIGLFEGHWWQWQTAAYWAVRGLVIVGGAVLGYVAGTVLLKIIGKFLTSNPSVLAKVPGVVKWFLGLGSTTTLTSDSVAQFITSAKRVGSALKSDLYHRAASWLSSSQLAKGKVYYINNGKRILLQVNGELNGKKGIFEYIIDEAGDICHQVFKAGGLINGRPN